MFNWLSRFFRGRRSDATREQGAGTPPAPAAEPRARAPRPQARFGDVNSMPLRIESDARTHQGRVRKLNEDSFFAHESSGLWAVADGMGGHEHGEWASAKLVEVLGALTLPDSFDSACAAIADGVRAANSAVFVESQKRGKQMGSTIVAMFVRGSRYAIFWVGDSRAYQLRRHKLERLSRDHSQVQEMVDRGLLDPKDAIGHPMGHVLARAVGVRPDVEVDMVEGTIEPGDSFLLCSDGLHGTVDEAEIARMLGRGSPQEASGELVDRTLERGAPDNVTVIAISVSEPTLLNLPSEAA